MLLNLEMSFTVPATTRATVRAALASPAPTPALITSCPYVAGVKGAGPDPTPAPVIFAEREAEIARQNEIAKRITIVDIDVAESHLRATLCPEDIESIGDGLRAIAYDIACRALEALVAGGGARGGIR